MSALEPNKGVENSSPPNPLPRSRCLRNKVDSACFARGDLFENATQHQILSTCPVENPRKQMVNTGPIPLVCPLVRYLHLEAHKQLTLNNALQFRGKQPGSPLLCSSSLSESMWPSTKREGSNNDRTSSTKLSGLVRQSIARWGTKISPLPYTPRADYLAQRTAIGGHGEYFSP
jgi:hypothetical protein